MLTFETISAALAKTGSVRAAAALLGKPYTSVQWWLAKNGYKVEKRAVLVPVQFDKDRENGGNVA